MLQTSNIIEIFLNISYVYSSHYHVFFILSLCFGYACPLLTLLQLRYKLWCFTVYFRIISGDLTCAFQSVVVDFKVVYASLMHHSWT